MGNTQPVYSNNHSVPKNYWVDTYRSVDQKVIVKFDDFTFYPKCVIYYSTKLQIYNTPRPSTSVKGNTSSNYKNTYGSSSINSTISKSSYNSANGSLRNSNPPLRISVATDRFSARFVSTSNTSSSNSAHSGLRISNPERPSASVLSSNCNSMNSGLSTYNPPRRIPVAPERPAASKQSDCTIL